MIPAEAMASPTPDADRLPFVTLVVAAVISALTTGGVLVGSVNSGQTRAAVLVGVGVVLFVVGLVSGSTRTVSVATVPMLGALVWHILVTTEQVWSRSLVIGCLWFGAVELAMLSVRWRTLRRQVRWSDFASYPTEVDIIRDRLAEVFFVVGVSSIVVVFGTMASVISVSRTAFVQTVGLFVVALAVGATRRALGASASADDSKR